MFSDIDRYTVYDTKTKADPENPGNAGAGILANHIDTIHFTENSLILTRKGWSRSPRPFRKSAQEKRDFPI